jgi:hypothetical protein
MTVFEVVDAVPDDASQAFLSALEGQSGSTSEPYIYTQ